MLPSLDFMLQLGTCADITIEQQREANKTISVVTHQLNAVAELTKDFSKIVIAYEPVW